MQHASYIQPDLAGMTIEYDEGVTIGEKSGIDALDKIFKWMRGDISAWYGWSNAGKGTFFDYLSIVKAKRDNWKFCMMKQEDMSGDHKGKISANVIYNNLIWHLTGKTPYKHFAEKYQQEKISLPEYHEALEFIEQHFFVLYPQDRRYDNVFDNFRFYNDKFKGIDCFLIDPFKSLILDGAERGDFMMTKVFIMAKEFALQTNSSVNFINHAKSMNEVKDKDGKYKVVTQFMQLGGSAWDINLDSQFSIYRPNAHLDPNDPDVELYNLKQRKSEIVGARKGVYSKIRFDFLKKQFYFDDLNPLTGLYSERRQKEDMAKLHDFSEPKPKINQDDVPF